MRVLAVGALLLAFFGKSLSLQFRFNSSKGVSAVTVLEAVGHPSLE